MTNTVDSDFDSPREVLDLAAPTGTTDPLIPHRRIRLWMTVAILTCVVGAAFEGVAVTTAMPAAAKALGDNQLYAWSFTAFMAGSIMANGIAGRVADLVGPVKPLFFGLVVFVSGLIMAGFAPSMMLLIGFRVIQGLGVGCISLAMLVIVGEAYRRDEQARVIFAFSFCWVFPSIGGPSLAAWIAENWGWQWVFWSAAPLLVIAAGVGAVPLLRFQQFQSRLERKPTHSPSWFLAVGVAVGAACLQGAGQLLNWVSLCLLVVAVVSIRACLPKLMPDGFTLRPSGMSAVVLVRAIEVGAFYGCEVFMTLMLTTAHHVSLKMAGVLVTIGSCGWAIGSWLVSRSWMTLSRWSVIVVSTVVATCGLALLTVFVWVENAPLWISVVAWGICSVGVGMGHASHSLATLDFSTEQDRGHNTGALQMSEGIGSVVIVGLAGTIYASLQASYSVTTTFGWVFIVNLVIAALAIPVAMRIGPVPVSAIAEETR